MCGANARAAVALPFVYSQDGSGPATEATGQWLRLSDTGYSLGWRFRVVGSANAAAESDGIQLQTSSDLNQLNTSRRPCSGKRIVTNLMSSHFTLDPTFGDGRLSGNLKYTRSLLGQKWRVLRGGNYEALDVLSLLSRK